MTLEEGINLYVQRKQAVGLLFVAESTRYRAFLKTVGNLPLNELTVHHVLQFLSLPLTTPRSFRVKHSLLRHFFDYWAAQGAMQRLPMPPNRSVPRSNHLPYIYTRKELRRLLRLALSISKPRDVVHPKTLRAILLTLYATGANVSEVTRLGNKDVDFRNGRINFSAGWSKTSRCIPVGGDLVRVAQRYAEWKKRIRSQSQFFFPRIDGNEITTHTLLTYFVRLRRAAGIVGYPNSNRMPCLLDLRATYAVHQITSWIKKKRDLNVMLPALGAYMGNTLLESMERYLQVTPERFQSALNKLSPQNSCARWRDNSTLIEFLANL